MLVNQCAEDLKHKLNSLDSLNESKEFDFLVEIDEKHSLADSARFDFDKENQSENVVSLRSQGRPSVPFDYYASMGEGYQKNEYQSYANEEGGA